MIEPARARAAVSAPGVRLADFIREEMDDIIAEWVAFASAYVPAGANMTQLALRDHIVEILTFVADDLESPQNDREQDSKSKGKGPAGTRIHHSAAEIHASLRLKDGFNIDQMVSEYRALRASVVKQWNANSPLAGETDIYDLTRFNESIDQAIAESVAEYTSLINHSRNLFLGILGHDLRNPIGAVSMAGEMLQRHASPDTKLMTLATQIVDASQRGIQILNDLLDITRSAFGADIPITRAPMDMGQLANQLVEEMRSLAIGREIRLNRAGELGGAWDKARIGQVFSNLIGNAIQYSSSGSVISVSVTGDHDHVVLSVHNDGSPIPVKQLNTIFEALTRGHPAEVDQQVSSHLGLGLYISKKIVMAHNGTLDVVSTEGEGTMFKARLPRK